MQGQKIGRLWYVSKENLEAFLEGDKVIIREEVAITKIIGENILKIDIRGHSKRFFK